MYINTERVRGEREEGGWAEGETESERGWGGGGGGGEKVQFNPFRTGLPYKLITLCQTA